MKNNKIIRSKIIFRIFLFVLIFSPLAFGTVEPWSYTFMESLSIAALFLFFLKTASSKEPVFYNMPGIIPLLFLLGYILFQLVPLPSAFVALISPERYQIQKETVGAFEQLNWISLTINKKATLMEFFRIAAYAAFYIVTVQLLTKKELLKKTITVVIYFAAFMSFFGILQFILSNNKIYWVRELTKGGAPFGPYVNHNHYAGLMGMLFPLVLSQFLYHKPKITDNSFRERIVEFFDQHKTNIHIVLGFSAVLIATTMFLSISRGAIISLSASMVLFGILLRFSPLKRKRGVIIILIIFLVLLFVSWFGWEPIFKKFGSTINEQGDLADLRINIFKDSSNIIKDFFFTGTGFGSFSDIYKMYRTIPAGNFVDHAHNDYTELFTDGGVIAFLLAVWFLSEVFMRSYMSFRRRNNTYALYLYIGSVTGIIYMLAHSLFDFNLHIGANGLFFFFLAGLVVSSANTRLRDTKEFISKAPSPLPTGQAGSPSPSRGEGCYISPPLRGGDEGEGEVCGFTNDRISHNKTHLKAMKIPAKQFSILTGVILFACVVFNSGILMGSWYFSSAEGLNIAGNKVRTAALFDPFEPKYHYAIANIEKRRKNMEQAAVQYNKAVQLSPVNGEYVQKLGLIYSDLGQFAPADRLLQSGIRSDISDPLRYRVYASWLFARGETEKGIGYIKSGISMEPDKARTYIALMVLHGLPDSKIKEALPGLLRPYLQFAGYLEKTGNEEMAGDVYREAVDLLKKEKELNISYFYEIFRYYMKKDLYDEALNVMKTGIELFPEDAGLRMAGADLYEKMGNKNMAMEEYQKALFIDPRNKQARAKLEKLQPTNK
ncbi:MAG: hypothetical protein A2X59_07350 [Nitrospirae bacterium GWC2_42_7]|nr:MAG: hypothetical protein A2X59_07350 [Nitrospirae bacterium GWC2_42_7]